MIAILSTTPGEPRCLRVNTRLTAACALFVASLCLMFLSNCSGSAPRGAAAELVKKAANRGGECQVFFGDWLVVEGDGIFFGQGTISLAAFKEAQHWEQAGLISIAAEDVLSSSKPFSWDDWFARTQRKELKKVRIDVTSAGSELTEVTESGHFLTGRCYGVMVDKVVSDREVEVRTDRYRVIQAKVRREAERLGELLASVGHFEDRSIQGDFKLRLLLKWDAFENEWLYTDSTGRIVGGIDIAPLAEDFKTEFGLPPS